MAEGPTRAARRLDRLLTEAGHFETRARARDAILRGTVRVGGAPVTRPGARFAPDSAVEVLDPAGPYVSRAALKLIAGLDRFGLDPAGRDCLDIGASTGGFTQVLLERGAARIVAVDAGHGQLHPRLTGDPRVELHENVNARDLDTAILAGRAVGALVADVSFISLKQALPSALGLAAPGCFCVLLVKPQFEAGRAAIGRGGSLKDPALGEAIAANLLHWLGARPGWRGLGACLSPVAGGEGASEYLLAGLKDAA